MNGLFREEDMQSVEMTEGIVRKMVSCGERCQIIRFDMRKGVKIPPHAHPHEQIGYLVRGRFLMRVGDDEFEVREGEGYAVEPNVEHSVEMLEDSIAMDVFAPPRDEYR